MEDIIKALEEARAIETRKRCKRYSGFMSHLNHGQADAVYWSLIAYQLTCLVYVVVVYENVTRKYKDTEAKARSGEYNILQVEELRDRARRIAKIALLKNSIVLMTLVIATVMEVFSADVLLFCHNESLMHLYFPVWTMFAIGITVATLGCCIAQAYAIKSMQLPPFGVSLGTPVLVVGAISHFAYSYITGKGRTNWAAESGLNSSLSPSRDAAPGSGPALILRDIEAARRSGPSKPVIQLWDGDELPRDAVHIGTLSQGYHVIERSAGASNLAKATSVGTASSATVTNSANGDGQRTPPMQQNTTVPPGNINFDGVGPTLKFKEPPSRPS
ncbi:hypothetical protein B2J93_4235 [Marssonina coronariae]|uniref:Uncharacterized protein n=1 Tax=Diplocarpon coronariae TaxID=2795749 RepID=A0A218ZA30_9HELO|nr:hypothetical protein B2J93_4235 [Marssonina coronariae]